MESLTVVEDLQATSSKKKTIEEAAEFIISIHQEDAVPEGTPNRISAGSLKNWAVVDANGKFGLTPIRNIENGGIAKDRPIDLRRHAFTQLMNRLGAPTSFIRDRLPTKLQLATTNWLLQNQEEKDEAVLHLRGGEVPEIAAITSPSYTPLAIEKVIKNITSGLYFMEETSVMNVSAGMIDSIRIVFPSREITPRVGDISRSGLDVLNGNFANSAIHIRPILWRLVCTNGLIVAKPQWTKSIKHIGELAGLKEKVAEAAAVATRFSADIGDMWKRSVDVMVDDALEFVADLRLTKKDTKSIMEELGVDMNKDVKMLPPKSAYDIINAITATARTKTLASRINMEMAAWNALTKATRN